MRGSRKKSEFSTLNMKCKTLVSAVTNFSSKILKKYEKVQQPKFKARRVRNHMLGIVFVHYGKDMSTSSRLHVSSYTALYIILNKESISSNDTLLLWNQTKSAVWCICNTSNPPASKYSLWCDSLLSHMEPILIDIAYGLHFGCFSIILFAQN